MKKIGIFLLFIAFAFRAQAGFVSGSYVGNGGIKSIAGLGFKPEVVLIKLDGTQSAVIATSTMTPGAAKVLTTTESPSQGIISSLDTDGFTVGSSNFTNTSGQTYYYTAFDDADGLISVGNFTPNQATTQWTATWYNTEAVVTFNGINYKALQANYAIAPNSNPSFWQSLGAVTTFNTSISVGYRPKMVWILGEGQSYQYDQESPAQYNLDGSNPARISHFTQGSVLPNYTKVLNNITSTGFSVMPIKFAGEQKDGTANGVKYNYVTFSPTTAVIIGAYSGNSVLDHFITSSSPQFMMVNDVNNIQNTWFKTCAMTGTISHTFSYGRNDSEIRTLTSTGFKLGVNGETNLSNHTYEYFSISGTSCSTSTSNCGSNTIADIPAICSGTGTLDLNNYIGNAAPGTWSISNAPSGSNASISNGKILNLNSTVAGNYTVRHTLTTVNTGCTAYAEKTFTINALPNIVLTENQTICAGTSTNLTASGATTYVWSPSTGLNNNTASTVIANPSTTTNYTVVGTTNGCTATKTVSVIVNPIPIVSISNQTICIGTTANFDAGSGYASYLWNTGETTSNIAPSAPGTYSVTVTNANGCSATANATLTLYSQTTNSSGASGFKSGTYVGNGGASNTITGLGFKPEVVLVKAAGGQSAWIATSTMTPGYAKNLSQYNEFSDVVAPITGLINSLDNDGFTVGNTILSNQAGVTYYYTVFDDANGLVKVGSFTPNGTSFVPEINTGEAPKMVWLFGEGANQYDQISPGQFIFDGVNKNKVSHFVQGGSVDPAYKVLNSLTSTGFTVFPVKYPAEVKSGPANGVKYNYVAFMPTANIATGSYTGTNWPGQVVPLNNPQFLMIKDAVAGQNTWFKTTAIPDNLSYKFVGSSDPATITSLSLAGFGLGTNGEVNNAGLVYEYFAIIGDPTTTTSGNTPTTSPCANSLANIPNKCKSTETFNLEQYNTTATTGTWSISKSPANSLATITGTTFNINNTPVGAYTVRHTLTGGAAFEERTFNITSAIYCVTAGVITNVDKDQCNGSIVLNIPVGATNITYDWIGTTNTTSSISGLCPGNYQVKITDGTEQTTIHVKVKSKDPICADFSAELTPTSALCPTSHNGTLTAKVSGGAFPYLYDWGILGKGEHLTNQINLKPDDYKLIITDNNKCSYIVNQAVDYKKANCNQEDPVVVSIEYTDNGTVIITCDKPCIVKDNTGTVVPVGVDIAQPDVDTKFNVTPNLDNISSPITTTVTIIGKNTSGNSEVQLTNTTPSDNTNGKDQKNGTTTITGLTTGPYDVYVDGKKITSTDIVTNPDSSKTIKNLSSGDHKIVVVNTQTGTTELTKTTKIEANTTTVKTEITKTDTQGKTTEAVTTVSNTSSTPVITAVGPTVSGITNTIDGNKIVTTITPSFYDNPLNNDLNTIIVKCTTSTNVIVDVVINLKPVCTQTVTTNYSSSQPTCNNGNNGSLSVIDLPSNASIEWFSGISNNKTAQVTALKAGTYFYKVYLSLANGTKCLAEEKNNIILGEPAPVKVEIVPTNIGIHTYTANVTGGSSIYNTYLWTGGLTTSSVTLSEGFKVVTVTDSKGCTGGDEITVPTPICVGKITVAPKQPSATGVKDGSITASYSVAGKTFTWTSTALAAVVINPILTGIGDGDYKVTVTPVTGCVMNTTVTLKSPEKTIAEVIPTSTTTAKVDNCDGEIKVNGIVQTSSLLTNLVEGQTYTIIACGDTIQYKQSFCKNANLSVAVTFDQAIAGQAIATAKGGLSPYKYQFTTAADPIIAANYTNVNTKSGIGTGSYVITVLDGNSCTSSTSFNAACGLTTAIDATPVAADCPSTCNGQITLNTIPSGYNILWNSVAGTAVLPNICEGTYKLALEKTDKSCTVSKDIIVTSGTCTTTPNCSLNPLVLHVAKTTFAKKCYEDRSEMEMNVTGGVGLLTYKWEYTPNTPNATLVKFTADKPGLSDPQPGSYKLTINDTRNCSISQNFTVTGSSLPFTLTYNDFTLSPTCNYTSSLTLASKFNSLTTVLKNPSGNSIPINTDLSEGIYNLSITDPNGCEKSLDIVVPRSTLFDGATVSSSKSTICENDERIYLNAKELTGYTYTWGPGVKLSPDGNNHTVTVNTAGTYTLTYTNTACNITKTVAVNIAAGTDCNDKKALYCETVVLNKYPEMVSQEEPCSTRVLTASKAYAQLAYQEYLETKKQDFRKAFTDKLLAEANESLVMSYSEKEYHYTLYYYDQSGNLTRTVPPAGVKPLNDTKKATATTAIQNNTSAKVETEHTMATTYLYNSLNQLVAQDMPDHETQSLVTLTPSTSTLTGTLNNVAVNGNNGLMLRTDANGFANIYASTDNAATWTQQTGFGLGNVLDIAQVPSAIWAVGQNGLCMTGNAAATLWTVKAMPISSDIIKVIATDANNANVISRNGEILKTTTAGTSWALNYTLSTLIGTKTITDFSFNTTEWIALTNTGELYSSTNQGLNWSLLSTFQQAGLTAAASDNTTNIYFAGVKGALYNWNKNTGKIVVVPSNHDFTIDKLELKGTLAYATDASGNIYKSTNITTSGASFVSWTKQTYTLPTPITKMLIYGSNNDLLAFSGTSLYLNGTIFSNTNITETPKGFASLGNSVYLYSNTKVFGFTGSPLTFGATSTFTTANIQNLAVSGSSVLVLAADNKVYNLTAPTLSLADNVTNMYQLSDGVLIKTSTATKTANGTTLTDIANITLSAGFSIDKVIGSISDFKIITKNTTNIFAINNTNLSLQPATPKAITHAPNLMVIANNSELYTYTNGALVHSPILDNEASIKSFNNIENISGTTYLTIASSVYSLSNSVLTKLTVPNLSNNIRGLTSGDSKIAVWENKNAYILTGNTWQQTIYTDNISALNLGSYLQLLGANNGVVAYKTKTATTWTATPQNVPSLNAVYYQNANNPVAVGVKGTIVTGVGTASQKTQYSTTTNDLTLVAGTGNTVWAAGKNATLLKSNNTGTTWISTTLPTGVTGDFTALAVSSSGVYAALGKQLIYKSATASSFTLLQTFNANINGLYLDNDGQGMAVGDNGLVISLGGVTTPTISQYLTDNTPNDDKGTGIPTKNLKAVSFTDKLTGYITVADNSIIKTADGGAHWHLFTNKLATATGTPILAINSQGKGALIDATGTAYSFADASDKFSSRFWYDELGRLCLSQNAKQFNIGKYLTTTEKQLLNTQNSTLKTAKAYSYTLYDDIGRIVEVGELIAPETAALPLSGKYDSQIEYRALQDFVTTNYRREITSTYYDTAAFSPNVSIGGLQQPSTFTQDNLRTRVASTTYQEKPGIDYNSASHYSYDVHGNVKSLVVEIDNKKLVKKLDYDYDLISGKVNTVTYQAGQSDQFIHRYEYDADNRITKVFTSKDGVLWDNDAKYQYYAHGPLARTVTGELAVETQNFVYTLQGWIKGLNGQNFSYALGYNNTDYASIGTSTNLATPIVTNKDLYNGNIATWTSKNSATANGTLQTTPWTQQFEYDQLNRIKSSVSLNEGNKFKTSYDFDANGNILAMQRYNEAAQLYDNFQYQYHNTTNGYKENTNQLRSITDPVALSSIASDDIDNQDLDNYTYDEIGQMIADISKEIEKVEWNLANKPIAFIRPSTSTKSNVYFAYDAVGQKISKTVVPKTGLAQTTYYVRDAAGNIMTEYTNSEIQHHIYGSSRIGIAKTIGKDYELIDHLGSIRTTITENGSISYAADYYPYGRIAKKYSQHQSEFGYNGKTYEEEIGLQDYGFRFYDTDGNRFISVDPLSKKYAWNSSYAYAENDVISCIDEDGLERYYAADGTKIGSIGTNTQVMLVHDNSIKTVTTMFKNGTATPEALSQHSRDIGMKEEELFTRAFMSTIKEAEGHGKLLEYDHLHYESYKDEKGKTKQKLEKFTGTDDHPYATRKQNNGTAAGAYQILYGSYKLFKKAYTGIPDFSPLSQDRLVISIFKEVKGLTNIQKGEWKEAVAKLTKPPYVQFASLPGGGQVKEGFSMESLKATIKKYISYELKGITNLTIPQGKMKENVDAVKNK